MVGRQAKQLAYPVPSTQHHQRKRRGQFQDVSRLPPTTAGIGPRSQPWHTCSNYGRTHLGPCRFGQEVCYKCEPMRHYIRDCPQRTVQQAVSLASQTIVQMERPREAGPS